VPLLLFSTVKLPRHSTPYSELGLTFERERERACGELLFEILYVHIISFWGTLKKIKKNLEKIKKRKEVSPSIVSLVTSSV
jgi:hypothetical protein